MTLNGPAATLTSNGIEDQPAGTGSGYVYYATAPVFSGPASLTVTGVDPNNSSVTLSYPFTIKKWFVINSVTSNWIVQNKWCKALNGSNYVMAKLRDVTNSAIGPAAPAGYPTPLSPYNFIKRQIGGSVGNEWAKISGYGWEDGYWSSNTDSTGAYYTGSTSNGDVKMITAATMRTTNFYVLKRIG